MNKVVGLCPHLCIKSLLPGFWFLCHSTITSFSNSCVWQAHAAPALKELRRCSIKSVRNTTSLPQMDTGRINKLMALGMPQQRQWVSSGHLLRIKLTTKDSSLCNQAPVAQLLICLRCAVFLRNHLDEVIHGVGSWWCLDLRPFALRGGYFQHLKRDSR